LTFAPFLDRIALASSAIIAASDAMMLG